MELSKFLKLLRKKWWLLLSLPLLNMVVTYFLVRKMPSVYTAQAMLGTGLVDETQHVLSVGDITFQESQVNQQFTNVIEMMKLKKTIDKVSYLLMIHDLSEKGAFRPQSIIVKAMSAEEKRQAIAFFKSKYERDEALNLWDKGENQKYLMLKSMKYDDESLNRNLSIYRKSNSDYVIIEFGSENAELSPFVANTLCQEFIKSYNSLVLKKKGKTSDYLSELLRQKYAAMNEKIALLKNYKIHNKILNLYEQSKILYTNIVLLDSRRYDAQKEIEAYNGAINNIDSKFNPNDRRYLEGALTSLNGQIISTKAKLQALSDQYLKSEYNAGTRNSMDSVQRILNAQINALTDQYIYDPLSSKKDLMGQKLSLEIQRDISKNSLNGLSREFDAFSQKFDKLVPFEAVIQSYERDIDIASREYLDILNKYNQLDTDPDNSINLSQIQIAMPGAGAPNKKILFVLVAGIITFALCVVILFILFFFNKAISSPSELAQKTQSPVLGYLNKLTGNALDLYTLWNGSDNSNSKFTEQKSLLRSIRYEVMQELGDKKIICITSLVAGKGATFLSINLAYAFATMHKKVLLIDGNFSNATISKVLTPSTSIENLFNMPHLVSDDFIIVAGNNGENRSPYEIAGEEKIKTVLEKLPFDIIIIDTEPINKDNKTKEWIACADKTIAVYENKQKISDIDLQQIAWLQQSGKFSGWVFNKYSSAQA